MLARQTIGSITLGSMPEGAVAIVGEGQRGLAMQQAPSATGDRSAMLREVVCSSAVPENFAAVVHPMFRPCLVPHLGNDMTPGVSMGPGAGDVGGTRHDYGAVISQDRGDPVLLLAGDNAARGVVRLVTT